jgi:hypothetical protein
MSISIKYEKRKNNGLFNKFSNINLQSSQNYIPIYDRFFSLNNTNWNSINLNHCWSISDIKETKGNDTNVFDCKLKHSEEEEITDNRQIFIKMAPLLDPFKYLVGKYNHNDNHLFNLPTYNKDVIVHPKIADPNNSSFIDGFFSFLTSKTLYEHQFIHGLDYYGSFLSIKNNYKINVIDDIDYLVQSEFFNYHKNNLFHIEDYSHLISNNDNSKLKPLKISASIKSNLSVKSIDQNIFENIFENSNDNLEGAMSLEDIKNIGVDIVDITNSNCFQLSNIDNSNIDNAVDKCKSLKSDSSCSSRTSHTNEHDLDDYSEEDCSEESDQEDDWEDCDSDSDDNDDNNDDDDDETNSVEETLSVTFPKFPVQVICMEKCENTFDSLIINDALSEDEWFSALMQIIMTLITYQKMFSFTHNDLHTNNIMYVSTNKKFIYYVYKKKTYKVPTFGKIYKIIDFGRSIYKFKGKLFCSDSFQTGGDASTQYNTEPYFNEKKPRLDPNFSFDLCRLACSIFDYVVDDFDMLKNLNDCPKIVKLIVEWCIDDNGINVLYKNNGCERYPDFKLYKMIARCVHNHTPQAQLERTEFSKYSILSKNVPKNESVINIDNFPIYVS